MNNYTKFPVFYLMCFTLGDKKRSQNITWPF